MSANQNPNTKNKPNFVEVALPIPLRQTFTYSIPDRFDEAIKVGARVQVSFGSRLLTGFVVEIDSELDSDLDPNSIKPIYELIDRAPLLSKEILALTKWSADYYSTSWGEMIRASLPSGINSAIRRIFNPTTDAQTQIELLRASKKRDGLQLIIDKPGISEREIRRKFQGATSRIVRDLLRASLIESSFITKPPEAKPKTQNAAILNDLKTKKDIDLTPAQRNVYDYLKRRNKPILIKELSESTGRGISVIKAIESKGLISIEPIELRRDPLGLDEEVQRRLGFELTDEQRVALNKINNATNEGFSTILLHGVTGSGKTEIYIRAMKNVVDQGKSALMLVPEIALTPVFSKQLRSVFGELVAILHSSLSIGERFDEWNRIRNGEARVVIGTRSAVFAPLHDLGLIVVDEEHDPSYRQHESPFYNGRDLAIIRAKENEAVVVLGSATPALETYFNAKQGKYSLLSLKERIGDAHLPTAEIIDLREIEKTEPHDLIITPQLRIEIEATVSRGEQVILLINRRGFSQFVLCRSCGESIKCVNCDVTLTFHRKAKILVCHYCDLHTAKPDLCPNCESEFLFFLGEGTEKIESILEEMFPELRIARVDRDTTAKKHELERLLTSFSNKEIDMLIGTQMLAKGHDFPNVTLVGVISADVSLSIPDFRSAERTFQLITQVAGRAGRGSRSGKVIIQTYYPDSYVIDYARKQDYIDYYEREIQFRERLFYPPFVAITVIRINHPNFEYAYTNAKIIREAFKRFEESRKCIILGPARAPIERLRGKHRLQIIIKSRSRTALRRAIDLALIQAETEGADTQILTIEVDPVSLL